MRPRAARASRTDHQGDDGLGLEQGQRLLERVVNICERNFNARPEGKAFLERKGLSDLGLLERHRVGYCDGGLTQILPKEDQDPAIWRQLRLLGILSGENQEHLRGCVVFPLLDLEGRIQSLCGVALDAGDLQHRLLPGRAARLWNAPVLKRYAELTLVDSVIDALSVAATGADNVLAWVGSGGLSETELGWFRTCQIQSIHLFRSGPENDLTPSSILIQLKEFGGLSCPLPGQLTPNRFLLSHGPAELAKALAATTTQAASAPPSRGVEPLPDGFAVLLGPRHYQIRGLEKGPRKLRATVRIEQAGKLHVDTLDFYSARWRRQLTSDLARVFEETAEVAEAEVLKLINLCESQPCRPTLAVPEIPMSQQARQEAEAFGQSPDLIQRIVADYDQCGLVGEEVNKLFYYLAAISRKLDHPLSVLILSSSGAGKSTLQDAALQFCPPEDVVKVTALSGRALFYKEQASLKHKVLALEEGEGMAEANYAIRNLVSAGTLVIESARRDLGSGQMVTRENRVEGPTAVFLTTTNPDLDPETKSRFFVTSVDEGRHQTQAILASQRQSQTLAGLADQPRRKAILERHRNFQRLLRPLAVVNPYADQLSYGDGRLESRRDQPRYLNLIRAVAFLRQMQKEVKVASERSGGGSPYIEVDREDIRLANELASQIMGHSLDELSRPGYDLLMILEKMTRERGREGSEDEVFTRRQVREFAGWNHSRVHRYLKELITLEYVVVASGRMGFRQTYRLCYDGEGKNGQRFALGLRPVDELKDPVASSGQFRSISPPFHPEKPGQDVVSQHSNPEPFRGSEKGEEQCKQPNVT